MTIAIIDVVSIASVYPYRWRRWSPKGTVARLRRRERRRRRAYREAERLSGNHGARYYGEAGPKELIGSWCSRDVPPWVGEGDE